jgi:hypothetical protein
MQEQDQKKQQTRNPNGRESGANAGSRTTSNSQGQTPPGSLDRTPPDEGGEDEPKETQPGGKDAPPDA